jgi:hypothetical protein
VSSLSLGARRASRRLARLSLHLLRRRDLSGIPLSERGCLTSSCRVRIDSSARLRVSMGCETPVRLRGSRYEVRTSTVARLGLTTFIFPSLPTMASHIWSHGGVASSSTTMNSGLSQRAMPLGSSYRKTKFSKSSSSYPPSLSLSARSLLLFSRHRSAGVPTCSSRTVSKGPRTSTFYTDDAAGSL